MKNLFPFFIHNPSIIYLDSAATSLKLKSTLDAQREYEEKFSTNAARGLYPLAEKTNAQLDRARNTVAHFLKAKPEEVIFTAGTTAGINLITNALTETFTEGGDILVAVDSHHSNLLPWMKLAEQKKHVLKTIALTKSGSIDKDSLALLLSPNTKVVAISAVSNVYGVKNDITTLTKIIRAAAPHAFIFVDAAQAVAHMSIDVTELGIDALVFSSHKIYAPTGAGVLWLAAAWTHKLAPGYLGGGMALNVITKEWKSGPEKFEAGTLPLGSIFGLVPAIEFIAHNKEILEVHEKILLEYAFQQLESTFGNTLTILGSQNPTEKIGLISFVLAGVHPHDIASILGEQNICVRAGEHCASPLHQSLSLSATTRISFGPYTTQDDIDALIKKLKEIYTLFQK